MSAQEDALWCAEKANEARAENKQLRAENAELGLALDKACHDVAVSNESHGWMDADEYRKQYIEEAKQELGSSDERCR